MGVLLDMSKEWAESDAHQDNIAFDRAINSIQKKDCECDRCHHHYVCRMCDTHRAENYKGCDYFLPYLLPAVPFKTFDTETKWRNAWNEAVADTKRIRDIQAEYETKTNNVSGLID